MNLSLRTRDIAMNDELREQVTRRLAFALDTFEEHVEEAFVYLMDLNGPKGGVDKLCQITVRVRRIGELPVRETGPSVRSALNRAVRRLKYRLAESIRAHEELSRATIRAAEAGA